MRIRTLYWHSKHVIQFVCNDSGNSAAKWYYNAAERRYFRLNSKGAEQGRIRGEFLPDPDAVFEKRKMLYPQATHSVIRPTDAAYALWSHWQNAQG